MPRAASDSGTTTTAKLRPLRGSIKRIRRLFLRDKYKVMELGLNKLEAAWRQLIFAQGHAIEIARSVENKLAHMETETAEIAAMQPWFAKLESFSRQQAWAHGHAIETVRSVEERVARAESALRRQNALQLHAMAQGHAIETVKSVEERVARAESALRRQNALQLHAMAIEDQLAGWRQHVPAFLNAVSSVGAFGFELSRVKRQFSDFHISLDSEIAGLWEKARGTDSELKGLLDKAGGIDGELRGPWENAGTVDREIRGLRDNTVGTTHELENLWGIARETPREPECRAERGVLSDGNRKLCLHDRYVIRSQPMPFDDRFNKDEWQREVYETARQLADENRLKKIVDFGCGSAFKLLKHFSDCLTVGYEVGTTLEYLRQTYPTREWRSGDLLNLDLADCDLLICSNVIEHVSDPAKILDAFSHCRASLFVISTPALELLSAWGFSARYGPPTNQAHRCEWTTTEFYKFVSKYLLVVDHTISNLKQATQLIIARRYDDRTTVEKNAEPPGSVTIRY